MWKDSLTLSERDVLVLMCVSAVLVTELGFAQCERIWLDTLTCGWAEAHIKIARMTLTIKLDRNWSSFQLANSAPPLSVTDSAIAPSARILVTKDLQ